MEVIPREGKHNPFQLSWKLSLARERRSTIMTPFIDRMIRAAKLTVLLPFVLNKAFKGEP